MSELVKARSDPVRILDKHRAAMPLDEGNLDVAPNTAAVPGDIVLCVRRGYLEDPLRPPSPIAAWVRGSLEDAATGSCFAADTLTSGRRRASEGLFEQRVDLEIPPTRRERPDRGLFEVSYECLRSLRSNGSQRNARQKPLAVGRHPVFAFCRDVRPCKSGQTTRQRRPCDVVSMSQNGSVGMESRFSMITIVSAATVLNLA